MVRMAMGQPIEKVPPLVGLERQTEPIAVATLEELEQVLSGIFAAISLLGPGDHLQINIDAAPPEVPSA